MKLCLNESWESFAEEAERMEAGIILFGASSCADVFMNKIKQKFKIKYLVDNDKNKQGTKWEYTYDICSPDRLMEENETIVMITSTYHAEIIKQLEKMEYKGRVYSFLHLRNKVASDIDTEEVRSNINRLKEIMYDEKSRKIIDEIYQNRLNQNTDYSNIKEENQYFLEDIIRRDKDAVFVDAGAYDGKTVKDFIEFQGNSFKKVYSFEMDRDNFCKIDRTDFDDRVVFLNYGLWNEKKTVSYIAQCRGSEIAEEGNMTAECIALDEIIPPEEQVTFIKMDIEGAEQNALLGAERIITEYRPQLAICLYHSFEDLWEIPFLIYNMVPEYKFFIRHHSKSYQETVLYATI